MFLLGIRCVDAGRLGWIDLDLGGQLEVMGNGAFWMFKALGFTLELKKPFWKPYDSDSVCSIIFSISTSKVFFSHLACSSMPFVSKKQ